jgi:hypothetical protein
VLRTPDLSNLLLKLSSFVQRSPREHGRLANMGNNHECT